jgi:CIC family chloride channel protein
MKKKYVVDGLIETIILLGARLKLRDVFLEAFTSIIN